MAPPRSQLLLGFAVIYVVWGSTYLAIRYAVDAIPPLLMAGTRFLAAGAILWAATGARLRLRPSPRDVAWAFALGTGFFLMGNGFLSVAEQRIDSGLAALAIASVPMWVTLLEAVGPRWLAARTAAPRPLAWAGLAVGAAGVVLLAGVDGFDLRGDAGYVLLLLVGSLGWAVASLAGRGRMGLPMLPSVALQMLAGGLLLVLAGAARGELAQWDTGAIGARAGWSWAYLVVAGSVVAFSTYAWLLRHAAPSLVATYAFVNPLIAVALGAMFAHERIGGRTVLAGALIVAAVALVAFAKRPAPPAPKPLTGAEA